MKDQAYKQVLSFMASNEYNPNAIALGLAQEYPEIFLKLAGGILEGVFIPAELINRLREQAKVNKIEAIKEVREFTRGKANGGCASLRASKEFIESL